MRRTLFAALISAAVCALVLISLSSGTALLPQYRPLPEVPAALKSRLAGYLREQGMAPEAYVIGKFRDHDIVILGEHHFIKHNVEFVQGLIPRLYEAGVRDLAIEFGCRELQDRADALVTADTYDEALAQVDQLKKAG